MNTEAITWHPVSEPPDSEITVLIFDPTASKPVWPGYLDGEAWRFVDGMPANRVSWSEMQVGQTAPR